MLLKYYIQSVITQMLPNRCHELNKSAWRPHKHWVSKYILSLKLQTDSKLFQQKS